MTARATRETVDMDDASAVAESVYRALLCDCSKDCHEWKYPTDEALGVIHDAVADAITARRAGKEG